MKQEWSSLATILEPESIEGGLRKQECMVPFLWGFPPRGMIRRHLGVPSCFGMLCLWEDV